MIKRLSFLVVLVISLTVYAQVTTSPSVTGVAASQTNVAITGGSISGLNPPLPIASGGTASATATGSGQTVLATSPTLVTPNIGAATASSLVVTSAITPSSGGTGQTTLTAHGVLVGEGTAAVNQTAVGTTGQMLIGVSGADPVFGNAAVITASTITASTVDNTTIGATTASTGKFTTLQASGAITPSTTNGIVGTTLADSASAGSVGEYLTSATGPTSLTNTTAMNAASLTLTAGDWDVWGVVVYVPAAGTQTTTTLQGISTASATLPAAGLRTSFNVPGVANAVNENPSTIVRINVSTGTTVYLIGYAAFSVSTETATGFIYARRVR